MMLRALALVLSFAVALPAAAQDKVISYSESDPRMNAAVHAAQESLPQFLAAALNAQGMSQPGYIIKVALPKASDQTGREHIWVTPFARMPDGQLTGYLDNDPVDLGDLRYGDQITFAPDMISDWTFFSPRGRAYGQFTTRVQFEDGAFGDTPFDDLFEANPLPDDWK